MTERSRTFENLTMIDSKVMRKWALQILRCASQQAEIFRLGIVDLGPGVSD